jgi:hypothetical protein
VTWEEAIKPENYSPYWEEPFHLDCSPELPSTYAPDPGYNCNVFVDWRVTCPGENPPLMTIGEGVVQAPRGGTVGIFPGHYEETTIISKPLTLKAIEGTVMIGK